MITFLIRTGPPVIEEPGDLHPFIQYAKANARAGSLNEVMVNYSCGVGLPDDDNDCKMVVDRGIDVYFKTREQYPLKVVEDVGKHPFIEHVRTAPKDMPLSIVLQSYTQINSYNAFPNDSNLAKAIIDKGVKAYFARKEGGSDRALY
ncbi:hypothetical protein ACFLRF_00100 [Candidatus Altiarchaeota archaeon]